MAMLGIRTVGNVTTERGRKNELLAICLKIGSISD